VKSKRTSEPTACGYLSTFSIAGFVNSYLIQNSSSSLDLDPNTAVFDLNVLPSPAPVSNGENASRNKDKSMYQFQAAWIAVLALENVTFLTVNLNDANEFRQNVP